MSQGVKLALGAALVLGLAALGWVVYPRPPTPVPHERPHPGRRAQPQATASPALPHAAVAVSAVGGRVSHAFTGAPMAQVEVALRGEVELSATSDAAGRFELAAPPGRYRVVASGDGVVAIDTPWLSLAAAAPAAELELEVLPVAHVTGRVVDFQGAPMADVAVACSAEIDGEPLDPEAALPCSAVSDDDGAFALEVPPGRVVVEARAADAPVGRTVLPWVEPDARLAGVELVVDAGVRLGGVVRDRTAAAVPGAVVVAFADAGTAPVASAQTDAAGRFALGGLPAGAVRLEARAPGYGPSAPRAVELLAGDAVDDLTLVLAAADLLAGIVVDERGDPVAGAEVSARALRRGDPGALLASATTGADGRFELAAAGATRVEAWASGFAPARRDGAAGGDWRLVLRRAGGIAGTVTAGGTLVTSFDVRLVRHVPLGGTAPATLPGAVRFAAPDGSYRIDGLAPGSYELVIASRGWAPAVLTGVSVAPGELADGSVALAPAASIAGRVVDAARRRPIYGAQVTVATGYEGSVRFTDAAGAFAIADVAPGRRSLSVSHPGFVGRIEGGLELAPGARLELELRLAALAPRTAPQADTPIEFAGIGAAMGFEDDRLTISDVLPHSPAAIAGLRAGDVITAIDGVAIAGQGLGPSVESIRGVAGTAVRLAIARDGDAPFSLDVVRATIRFQGDE
jgi:hypothetical protein